MNEIATYINSMGFPIVVCIALAWYIYKIQDAQTTALAKLTQAINILLDRLKIDGEEDSDNA